MNKEELVKSISDKATKALGGVPVTNKMALACLDAFMGIVVEKAKKREDITLVGFGTFSTADRNERKGRNPQTGDALLIPAQVVPVFKPGKNLQGATATLKVRKTALKKKNNEEVAVDEE